MLKIKHLDRALAQVRFQDRAAWTADNNPVPTGNPRQGESFVRQEFHGENVKPSVARVL